MNAETDIQAAVPGAAMHVKTRVLPGPRVEVAAPGLAEGSVVDVFVVAEPPAGSPPRSAIDVIKSLQGHRSFANAQEADRHLEEERNAWDR
jgi:hypothetical protein